MKVVITLFPQDYDAVPFDLDGVLTMTASVRSSARKKLFDSFLEQRATQAGNRSSPLISTPITSATSMASRVTTAWQPSLSRAGSNCRWVRLKTTPMCKASVRCVIRRTAISCNTWRSMASIPMKHRLDLILRSTEARLKEGEKGTYEDPHLTGREKAFVNLSTVASPSRSTGFALLQ